MSRQQALELIWRRLLVLFVFLAVVGTVIAYALPDSSAPGLRVPLLVIVFGIGGGYVSVYRSLGGLKDEEAIGLASSWTAVIAPAVIGGILAFVVHVMFLSTILSGALFPEATRLPAASLDAGFNQLFHQSLAGPAEYAKLFFWSFFAGFNQKFAVGVIESVRSRT